MINRPELLFWHKILERTEVYCFCLVYNVSLAMKRTSYWTDFGDVLRRSGYSKT